jgi:hypothetical protein
MVTIADNRDFILTAAPGPERQKAMSAPMSAVGELSGLVVLTLSSSDFDPERSSTRPDADDWNVLLRAFEYDFCSPSGARRWIDHFEFVARQCDDASLVPAFVVRKKAAFDARDESASRFVQ